MLDNSLTDSPKSSASTQMKTMALLARLMVERNCSGKQMAYHRSREMKARCWRCPMMASSTQQAHVFADVLGRAGALYGPRGVTEPPAPAPAATPAQRPAPLDGHAILHLRSSLTGVDSIGRWKETK